MAQRSAGIVRALREIEKNGARIRAAAHFFIRQEKLAHLFVVKSGGRPNRCSRKSRRLRRGIRVKRRVNHAFVPRPKTNADDFVRIRFARHFIGARALGCAASGESRDGEIETAPEKMHRARFADEARAKFIEHGIDAQESAPKTLRMRRIVRIVNAVLVKANGIRNFDGHWPDLHANAKRGERVHEFMVEIRDGAWGEGQSAKRAVAYFDFENVLQEVELNFEGAFAAGNRRSGEAAAIHVEDDGPPVIHEWREREANFAYDLRPHV